MLLLNGEPIPSIMMEGFDPSTEWIAAFAAMVADEAEPALPGRLAHKFTQDDRTVVGLHRARVEFGGCCNAKGGAACNRHKAQGRKPKDKA